MLSASKAQLSALKLQTRLRGQRTIRSDSLFCPCKQRNIASPKPIPLLGPDVGPAPRDQCCGRSQRRRQSRIRSSAIKSRFRSPRSCNKLPHAPGAGNPRYWHFLVRFPNCPRRAFGQPLTTHVIRTHLRIRRKLIRRKLFDHAARMQVSSGYDSLNPTSGRQSS